jgi:two-component system, LytTR family, sensor kinase
MEAKFPAKKLFRIALFSSTLIGLITMGPVYTIIFSLGIISVDNLLMFKLIVFSVFGITFFVFLFWAINILLSYKIYKYSLSPRIQIWSYVIGFLLLFLIRFIAVRILLNHSVSQELIYWKTHEFGIHLDNTGFNPARNSLFSYLILVFLVFSINTIVLIFHGIVRMHEKETIILSENIQLKIKNIEATNQKLKQQLHPHFLFNSLNVLKTLIKKQPDNAEAYLKRLSDFLRASVSLDNVNTVKFEEELKLCMDYLEMQKIRFGNAIQFEISIPEEAKAGFVPTFSIQLLLENAIKHNAFTIESPLLIKLVYNNNWITVSNNIQSKNTDEDSPGLGLSNLSERYKIISGDEVNIQSTESNFSVSIKILSDENSDH